MHFSQAIANKDTEINVDAMLPKKSPEMLTVTFSSISIPFAMKRTGYAATLEKIVGCVCMYGVSLTRTGNFQTDMPKSAGRRSSITFSTVLLL